MTLRTMLGFSDSHLIEDTTTDAKRTAIVDEIRQARLVAARRNSKWTEIEDDLVPRARGLFVSAATDRVYTLVRGIVYAPGSASVVADRAPLYYTVSEDGELAFYERRTETWTEQLERKAERERRRAAPRETPTWAR